MTQSDQPTPFRRKFLQSAFDQYESLRAEHPGVVVDFLRFLDEITTDVTEGNVSGSPSIRELIEDNAENFEQLKNSPNAADLRCKADAIEDSYKKGRRFHVIAIFMVDQDKRLIVFVEFIGDNIKKSLFGD
jgi:hypothetical protein